MWNEPTSGAAAKNEFGELVYTADVAGRTYTLTTGRLARLAGGAVSVRIGETVVFCTATASKNAREGIDFFPLSVDVEEKLYAAGRIPGSFFRREGRPSEAAILSARLIDRPLRPLFPKTARNEVQVIVTAMASDSQNYIDIPGMIGASAALMISDVPFPEPIAGIRVGLVDGEFVMNPTAAEMEGSRLDLRLAGTRDAILMVECGADEVDEDEMVRAIRAGHQAMQPLIDLQNRMRAEIGKPKREFTEYSVPATLRDTYDQWVGNRIDSILESTTTKEERSAARDALYSEWLEAQAADSEHSDRDVKEVFDAHMTARVRERILGDGIRPDGRRPDDLRNLGSAIGLLPRVHGSGLFERGETQVMAIATLGTLGEEQRLDTLRPEETKRFLLHYNFPPFSTGETWFLRGPKRREIGHGALAETALRPMVPDEETFPYTIRIVAEVLASNGSTSMASVCASTLCLMDAGVPLKRPVAGIAMGLITDYDRHDRYQVLTDIQGMEDHIGDMDFKVAGTREGITALQMDMKLGGLSDDLLREALGHARTARVKILDNMTATIAEPRAELSAHAPRIITVHIDPALIGKLIGPGGKTIRAIQEQTGTKLDVQEDGTVYIASVEGAGAELARQQIEGLTGVPEVGKLYEGKVVRIEQFGAFVEIMPGTDGLVHISQLSDQHVERVEDVIQEGDEILVMVTDVAGGKVRLSRQAVLEGWTLDEARERDKAIGQSGGGRRRPPGGGGGGGRR
jgi:polyribonucleotide nucleotidyltransferase